MAEAVAFSPADLHPLKNVQGAPHCVHFQISYHTMVLFSRKFSPYLYTLTGGKRVSASSEVDLLIYHFSGMQWRNITNQSCPPIMSSFFHFLYICLQVRIKGAYAEVISYNKKSLERELQMGKILEDMRNEAELNKAKRMAIRMIKAGKMSLEDIADYTELSLDTIKELASQSMQLA